MKGLKLWRFDNTISEFWAYFHCAYAETLFRSPVQNLTLPFAPATSISYKEDIFPLLSDVYGKYSMCLCYYVALPCETLTFDLLTLRVFRVQCFLCPTHIPILIILQLSVTELRLLHIWSHFRYLKQSLYMRRVTWPITSRQKWSTFWNSWSQICLQCIHFVTSRALRRRLSHVIGENGVYPIVKATKFTAHAQYHVTCE